MCKLAKVSEDSKYEKGMRSGSIEGLRKRQRRATRASVHFGLRELEAHIVRCDQNVEGTELLVTG